MNKLSRTNIVDVDPETLWKLDKWLIIGLLAYVYVFTFFKY
jgi:hypothetical protein